MAGRAGERTRAPRTTPTAKTPAAAAEKPTKASQVRAAFEQHAASLLDRENALTAAAQVYDADGKVMKAGGTPTDVSLAWEAAVLGYVKVVPELGAASAFMGHTASMVGLELGRRNPDGSVDPAYEETVSPTGTKERKLVDGIDPKVAGFAEEAISSLRTEIGGQAELLRSFGEKYFLLGEGYLVPRDTPGGITFDFVSRFEVKFENGKWYRVGGPGQTGQDEMMAPPIRIYRPDPQWSGLATSSVRSCLEVLEELVILTRLVRGSALSRMSLSGMVVIAEEADEALDPNAGEGDSAEQTNPLLVDIISQGIRAIDDPSAPAAWMPYLLQIPFEYIDKGVKFIEFKSDDSISIAKRDEAVARLARGLDMPYETVMGHQSTTFANAMQISLDLYRIHIQPPLTSFADAATAAVVWPYVAKKMGIDQQQIKANGYPPEILDVAILLDPDRLTAKPDQTAHIIEAYAKDTSQTAIANSELRDAVGLDPNGGPDDDETERRVEHIQRVKERITVNSPTGEAPPPPVGMAPLVGLVYQIAGAAEQTVERSIEKVGAKLRQRATRGIEAEMIAGRENHEIPRILGAERTQGLLDGDPIAAEIRSFSELVRRWAAEAGHPKPDVIAETFTAFMTGVIAKRMFGIGPEVSPEICRPLVLGVSVTA